MPAEQKKAMIESLSSIDNLLNALAKTKIENADASRDEDKEDILLVISKIIILARRAAYDSELVDEEILSSKVSKMHAFGDLVTLQQTWTMHSYAVELALH